MKPFRITSILAPTDLSESNVPALRYARLFADRFSAKITVMYTDPLVYPFDVVGPANGYFVNATPEHQAEMRSEVARHAGPAMAGRPFEIDVGLGRPILAILSAATERGADLIIMGRHLRHGWQRAILGSVSGGVMHASECPVLTVASRDDDVETKPCAITNILCPVNFTEVAQESVHVAARLAEAFEARLAIVHVLDSDEVSNVRAGEERVRQWVAPQLQDVFSYRELVGRGGPAERVLDCADDLGADFLVIGAQHRLFRDATVIGTTTERVVRLASCPVLVVSRQAVGVEALTDDKNNILTGAIP